MSALIPLLRSHRSARHTASPTSSPHRGPAHPASWGVPAAIALAYCLYAAFVAGGNGHSTGRTWLIALVSAGILAVVCFAVGRWQTGRQPESVGTVYGVVFGCAMGYLLSLNEWSILKASLVGLALAASMGVCAFYVLHTRGVNAPPERRAVRPRPSGPPPQNG